MLSCVGGMIKKQDYDPVSLYNSAVFFPTVCLVGLQDLSRPRQHLLHLYLLCTKCPTFSVMNSTWRTRQPSTAACPAWWAMGAKEQGRTKIPSTSTLNYLDRNPKPPLFPIFSIERETWNTRTVVVLNKRGRRLEQRPVCHLAQISLKKGAREHVLHCDGSFKGLAILRVWAKMLNFKQLSTAAAFVIHMLW